MRTLVIESATEACSAALFGENELIAGNFEVIGRGHAERLVPMIADLPEKGRASRIVVSLGPGSFTGVRIGLAAARALGLAWQAQVIGYPTLALVAAMARTMRLGPVTVCMSGGHGEWFVQDFGPNGLPDEEGRSLSPDEASARANHLMVAGSQAEALIARSGVGAALPILPDAREFLRLHPSLLVTSPAPIYGRPPDARLPG